MSGAQVSETRESHPRVGRNPATTPQVGFLAEVICRKRVRTA